MRCTHRLIASVGLILVTLACGGSSPTQPATPATGAPIVSNVPAPPPPAPPPAPAPPGTPAPAPTPAPQPPTPTATYAATTAQVHWFGPDRTPLFGETFIIEVWPNDIWMHNTKLPIVHRGHDGLLIARDGPMIEVELRPATGKWYLRGGKGDGYGTMVKR